MSVKVAIAVISVVILGCPAVDNLLQPKYSLASKHDNNYCLCTKIMLQGYTTVCAPSNNINVAAVQICGLTYACTIAIVAVLFQ